MGPQGGLLILYKAKIYKVKPICNKENILLCVVENLVTKDSWFVLNIYAPNSRREMNAYWSRVLLTVQGCNVNKGIIMGDFNTPLTDQEKSGGLVPNLERKQDLASFINNLAFLDVDLPPGSFTWSNRRVGAECIQVRLDRALISFDWLSSFSSKLSLLPKVGSDHPPLLSFLPLLMLSEPSLSGLRRCGFLILLFPS